MAVRGELHLELDVIRARLDKLEAAAKRGPKPKGDEPKKADEPAKEPK